MDENKVTLQNYLKGLVDLATKLVVNPVGFYQDMPKTGGIIEPLIFVVMTVLVGVVINAAESYFSYGAGIHDLVMMTTWLIIAPLIAAILSFFVAAICFAIWTFTGSEQTYETSYRCVAYAHILLPITILLSFVPYLGLLGIAWWLYLMVIATREVHKISIKPALLIFGIIAASSGLVYYNSVTSILRSKEHLKEFTKELQKMPGSNDMGNSGIRRQP
jgi:hypothetical protein